MIRALLTASFALALGACASTPPPTELLNARQAYNKAKSGTTAAMAPAQLYDAQKTLSEAERAFADDPDAQSTKDLAYVAHRKAIFAEAYGGVLNASREREQATAQLQQLEQQRMRSLQSQLGQAQQQLGMTQQQLDDHRQRLAAEAQARAEAERKAQDALSKLEGLASMKKESRGTVITLSGNVLFASGKTELLGTAQQRLKELATAIKDDPRHITIVGHTDSQGDDTYNMTLSQKRAEAVRLYLVSQGMAGDRITATGMGETQPLADNANAEGRANNRRVEIVLEDNRAGQATQMP